VNTLRKAMMAIGGLTALILIMELAIPKTTHALVATFVEIVPNATTHVGQTQSQLVNLYCGTVCYHLSSDGTLSTSAFQVPAGQSLVITDWEWQLYFGPPNVYYCANVMINGRPEHPLMTSCALSDSTGTSAGKEHLTTGIVVASGFAIDGNDSHFFLQGYLVPNQ
jgi:hypothetical protein